MLFNLLSSHHSGSRFTRAETNMAHLGRYELKKLSILLVPIELRWVIRVEMNIVIHGDHGFIFL